MPRAIGLDIGRTSVKVASVDVTSKRIRLLGFAVKEIEQGLSEEEHKRSIQRTIDTIFREGRFDKSNVICSLESDACILRDITVPFKSREQISKIIRFEAEHHLVATSIDEVIVDYMKVGEIGEKSRLLLVAARKDRMRERLDLLDDVGIDPPEFELDAVAIFNAVTQTPLGAEHDNYVIVDVGAKELQIMVIEERGLSHVRVSRMGSDSGISSVPSSDPRSGDPRNLVNVAGSAEDGADLEKARQSYLDRMTRVLRQFLMGVRLRNPPELIILTGDGSWYRDVADTISKEFELPCNPVDFARHMELEATVSSDYTDKLDTGATAIGLALKGCGADRGGMSFRKDDLAYQRRFEQIRLHLVALSMLAFLVAFVPAAYFFKLKTMRERTYAVEFTEGRIWDDPSKRDRGVLPEFEQFLLQQNLSKATRKSEEELQADLKKVKQRAPRKRIAAVEKLLDGYEEAVKEARGASGEITQIESALELMAEVFRRLEEAARENPDIKLDPLRLLELDITPRQVTMKLWSPTREASETVKRRLKLLAPRYFEDDPAKGWNFSGKDKEEDGGVTRVLKADRISEDERKKRMETN